MRTFIPFLNLLSYRVLTGNIQYDVSFCFTTFRPSLQLKGDNLNRRRCGDARPQVHKMYRAGDRVHLRAYQCTSPAASLSTSFSCAADSAPEQEVSCTTVSTQPVLTAPTSYVQILENRLQNMERLFTQVCYPPSLVSTHVHTTVGL